jgi:hypothetical protein
MEPLAVLFVDQPLNQIGDVLLPASGCVQRAADLGETPIDVSAEVDEALNQGIETRRRSVSEVADFGSDLGDVPVGRLQCVNAPLEIDLTHRVETTGAISAGVSLIAGLWTKSQELCEL